MNVLNGLGSESHLSPGNFLGNAFVEFIPSNGLSSIPSDVVDNFIELFITVVVFELLIDVPEVIHVQLFLALDVQ